MVLASVQILAVLVSARASDTCIDDDATALLQGVGRNDLKEVMKHRGAANSTVSTYRRSEGPSYEFVHDGHCAGGWLGGNSRQGSVAACSAHCNSIDGCGFFAFCDGPTGCDGTTDCALYSEAGQCPDDNHWGAYNAYRVTAQNTVQIYIGNSQSNTRCVTTPVPVVCAQNSGHSGNRINNDYQSAADTFSFEVTGYQVCASRTDVGHGWGMRLEVECEPAPGVVMHNLHIGRSGGNTKCATAPGPVVCADDAGHLGNRLNSHTAGDTFDITVNGAEVCATRTDVGHGWGMDLQIPCVALQVCTVYNDQDVVAGTFQHGSGSGSQSDSDQACIARCTDDPSCTAWVRQPSTGNCWLSHQAAVSFEGDSDRHTGHRCQCRAMPNQDVKAGTFQHFGADGTGTHSDGECSARCTERPECTAWVRQPSTGNCWLTQQTVVSFEADSDRNTGLRGC